MSLARLVRSVPPQAALALLTGVLFAEIVVGGRVLYERDIHLWFYGQAETLVRIVAAGAWPVWDPYLAFGQPLLGNPGTQVLYPWTWLNLLMQPPTYYDVYVIGHHLISAFGAFHLAGRLGVSRQGSLVTATLWAASGPLLSYVNLWQHFAGAAWIPWVLVAADRAISSPRVGRALAWGAAVALQLLAGSIEMSVITAALTVLLLLRHLVPAAESLRRGRRLAATLGAAGFALGLSAAVWVPALDMLGSTRRSELEASVRLFWSLHPVALAQSLWPLLLKDLALSEAAKRIFADGREPFLASLYLGLAAVPLVAAALASRSRAAWALAGAMAVAVVLALGRHAPLYEPLVLHTPVIRVFRYPIKLMIVPALAWALLAGLGFDRWQSLGPSARKAVTVFTAAAIAIGVCLAAALIGAPGSVGGWLLEGDASPLRMLGAKMLAAGVLAAAVLWLGAARRLHPAVVVGVLAMDLAIAHRGLNETLPRGVLDARPPALAAIEAEARGPTRVYAFSYTARTADRALRRPVIRDAFTASPRPPLSAAARQAVGLQQYLCCSTPSRWGLYSGFWADYLAIGSRKLYNLDFFLLATEETPGFVRMMRIAAVSHVLALHTEGLEDLQPVATLESPFERQIRVFRVPDPLPRVYVAANARVVDGFAAYQALVDPGFDAASEIVLPTAAGVWEARADVTPSEGRGAAGGLRALEYGPDRIRASVGMARDGYLVVADAWAPGWRASVDGHEAPVLRANVAFRAVPVPAGDHDVQLVYRPPAIRYGLAASAATLAMGLLAALLGRWREGDADGGRVAVSS